MLESESARPETRGVRNFAFFPPKTKPYERNLAQTLDRLSFSWAADNSHLFPRSSPLRRRQWRMDQPGFPRTYLLEFYCLARHPHRVEFNRRRVVPAFKHAFDPSWLNRALFDSAGSGHFRL